MNEGEWMNSADPDKMLDHLYGKVGDRKLRLFACACCRSIWNVLRDEASRAAVEVADRFADGMVNADELDSAKQAVRRISHATCAAAASAIRVAVWAAREAADYAARAAGRHGRGRARERERQAAFLRCIFGYSFRPIAPTVLQWNKGTVKRLAEEAYQERLLPSGQLDNARLTVLADALEEAGVTDPDILGHFRQPGAVHIRGCWPLDLILGRE